VHHTVFKAYVKKADSLQKKHGIILKLCSKHYVMFTFRGCKQLLMKKAPGENTTLQKNMAFRTLQH